MLKDWAWERVHGQTSDSFGLMQPTVVLGKGRQHIYDGSAPCTTLPDIICQPSLLWQCYVTWMPACCTDMRRTGLSTCHSHHGHMVIAAMAGGLSC